MLDRMVGRDVLLALVDELARTRRVIGPVARNGRFFYEEVQHAGRLDPTFPCCVYGPRAFLFPPRETLFTFRREDRSFVATPVFDDRPMAFIGVHPCDLHAIRLLDHVFGAEPPDEHYLIRRRNSFIVGMDCPQPCSDAAFCADMKTHDADEGFDVMLYPLGGDDDRTERFVARFGTPAGRDWLLSGRSGTAPTAADQQALERYRREKAAAFPRRLSTPVEDLPDLPARAYDPCISCATHFLDIEWV